MPAGTRIRANNVFGATTNNPLAAGATTLNAPELALLPEVSGDHAVLTLDPLRQNGEPEIVIVTAHGPGATSATIQRGAYNTIDRQHPLGTIWVHAPVTEDVIIVTDSANRPADPYDGQLIFETDTNSFIGRIAGAWQGLIPSGSIQGYGGVSAPNGWLLCDGAAVSRTVFADLFATIGIAYGAGDGSTTFNVPNLQDRVPVGAGVSFPTLGATGGSATSTATHTHGLANHTHGLASHIHNVGSHIHLHDHNHTINSTAITIPSSGTHIHPAAANQFVITSATGPFRAPDSGATGQFVTFTTNTGSSSHGHSVPSHNHTTVTGNPAGTGVPEGSTNTGVSSPNTSNAASPNTSDGSSVGLTNGNMQPFQVVNYIIKI